MTSPYQILGTSIPLLLAREAVLTTIINRLSKTTPDNVSVIGPKYIGKSVLLNGLAETLRNKQGMFDFVVYWDVRHQTPQTDAEFFAALREHLKNQLAGAKSDCDDFLDLKSAKPYQEISDVISYLEKGMQKVLVILDGLDDLLRSDTITKNLWDNLRSVAQHSNFRIVTGSRKKLRELCFSKESRTSDFWEIFSDPLPLGALSKTDWTQYLVPIEKLGFTLDGSAISELINWTGGAPLLASLCLKEISDRKAGPLKGKDINELAESIRMTQDDMLEALWFDCLPEEQDCIVKLSTGTPLTKEHVSSTHLFWLQQRGYCRLNRESVESSCRLMLHHALKYKDVISHVASILGTADKYRSNAKRILQMRLSHVGSIDDELKDYIANAIDQIDKPHSGIRPFRAIVERALALIWKSELPTLVVPSEWTYEWQRRGQKDVPSGTVDKDDLGRQMSLLRRMVDSGKTRVSRMSSTLLGNLKQVGDLGAHKGEETISTEFLVPMCLSAVELAKQIQSDLNPTNTNRNS